MTKRKNKTETKQFERLCTLNKERVTVIQFNDQQTADVQGVVFDIDDRYLGLQDVTNAQPLNTEQSALK